MKTRSSKYKNLHLWISAIIIFFVAVIYGTFPEKIFRTLFDFNVQTVDLKNIFRTLMCLYFGMISLWIMGILKSNLWKTATISNIIFMLSLAFGRILSLIIDGLPSGIFITGLIVELLLGFWGIKNLVEGELIET